MRDGAVRAIALGFVCFEALELIVPIATGYLILIFAQGVESVFTGSFEWTWGLLVPTRHSAVLFAAGLFAYKAGRWIREW